MTDELEARPPTRDDIASEIGYHWDPENCMKGARDAAAALLAEFSIVARGDTPPAPTDDLAKCVDYESIGTAIGESVFLSSQGFDDWPTLEQCKAAGVRATREIASELTDALRWRECEQNGVFEEPFFQEMRRKAFMAAWNTRAAVGDRPPTP